LKLSKNFLERGQAVTLLKETALTQPFREAFIQGKCPLIGTLFVETGQKTIFSFSQVNCISMDSWKEQANRVIFHIRSSLFNIAFSSSFCSQCCETDPLGWKRAKTRYHLPVGHSGILWLICSTYMWNSVLIWRREMWIWELPM
jgi:hypothetical protein